MTGTVDDRAAGVLVAAAAGDALGVPYEFAMPLTEEPQMAGGGLGDYAPGEYSDDTQMAVCIARVAASGLDVASAAGLDAVAEHFLEWFHHGATDVGTSTTVVLRTASSGTWRTGRTGNPGGAGQRLREAALAYFHANPRGAAGNGALMRTAVVGLVALDDREAVAAAARAVAELTHADPLAGDSCVLWSEAVRLAVTSGVLDVSTGVDLLPAERQGQWHDWIAVTQGRSPGGFGNNGFTVTALQDAWAAITSTRGRGPQEHVRQALVAAVQAGNDTDTVAAIAGGLLGALHGVSALPPAWRESVNGRAIGQHAPVGAEDLARLALAAVNTSS